MRDRFLVVCIIGVVCVAALAGIFTLLAVLGPDPQLVWAFGVTLPVVAGLAYGLARAFRQIQ